MPLHVSSTCAHHQEVKMVLNTFLNNLFHFDYPLYLSHYLTNLMHKILFHIKFYFRPVHVSSTCAHHQEVKIALNTYLNNLFHFDYPLYLSHYLTNLMHKILFHNKFYFMPLHVSSTCAHHREVKISLHSLWYHHTYRWPSRARDGHLQSIGVLCDCRLVISGTQCDEFHHVPDFEL